MERHHVLLILGVLIIILTFVYARRDGFFIQASTCQPGNFCPLGTPSGQSFKCPAGRYGSQTSLRNAECTGPCKGGCVCPTGSTRECPQNCPAGFFCPTGTGGDTKPVVCPEGYYCVEGVSEPTPCPAGRWCPMGTSGI
jgi:hypothetical protein